MFMTRLQLVLLSPLVRSMPYSLISGPGSLLVSIAPLATGVKLASSTPD